MTTGGRKDAINILCDNPETNDQRNPLYTLSTMNNFFHDKVFAVSIPNE